MRYPKTTYKRNSTGAFTQHLHGWVKIISFCVGSVADAHFSTPTNPTTVTRTTPATATDSDSRARPVFRNAVFRILRNIPAILRNIPEYSGKYYGKYSGTMYTQFRMQIAFMYSG